MSLSSQIRVTFRTRYIEACKCKSVHTWSHACRITSGCSLHDTSNLTSAAQVAPSILQSTVSPRQQTPRDEKRPDCGACIISSSLHSSCDSCNSFRKNLRVPIDAGTALISPTVTLKVSGSCRRYKFRHVVSCSTVFSYATRFFVAEANALGSLCFLSSIQQPSMKAHLASWSAKCTHRWNLGCAKHAHPAATNDSRNSRTAVRNAAGDPSP